MDGFRPDTGCTKNYSRRDMPTWAEVKYNMKIKTYDQNGCVSDLLEFITYNRLL